MWAQILNVILGLWLMTAPQVLNYNGIAADNDHIVGPLVASFAIIALSGCTRSVSKYNIPLGAWLLLAPWLLEYENALASTNDMAAGTLITVLSFFKRSTKHFYGGGWRSAWKQDSAASYFEMTENADAKQK
jgi:amino acid permease